MGLTMRVVELRIHGVGGSPGERLLGLANPDQAVVVGEGVGTAFLSRREQRDIEGYDWGSLTSGSALQPLWLLLLPFTLVNVAGWAHPTWAEGKNRRIRVVRILVHGSAGLLTVLWVLWIGLVAIDYLGYQWAGAKIGRGWGTALGVLTTVGLSGGLWLVARSTKSRFEGVKVDQRLLPTTSERESWGEREDLGDVTFFSHESSMSTRLGWHVALVVATLAAMVAKAIVAWGDSRLLLGELLVVVGGLAIVIAVVLGVVSWRTSGQYEDTPRAPALPAAAGTLAFALTNVFFSGVALLAAKLLPGQRPWGPELNLIDGFVWTVVAWAAVGAVWILWFRRRGRPDGVPERTTGPSEELDGADAGWRKKIAATRGLAEAAHRGPLLLPILAGIFLGVGMVLTVWRLEPSGPVWEWVQEPTPTLALRVAGWFLPAVVLAAMGLMRRAVTGTTLRRTVGILWDVLTFWPRRYHPLAVRPYTERAVPEFQARVNNHLDDDGRLFVSAHSQGSVLGFAALAPLSDDKLARVALLTYGCPITTLYGQAFPAYFGKAPVEALLARLLGGTDGWRNLWRRTDPIGGPVLGAQGADPVDTEVDDPATVPASGDIPVAPAGTEELRRAWVSLAGHSYFYREDVFKRAVTQLRNRLSH